MKQLYTKKASETQLHKAAIICRFTIFLVGSLPLDIQLTCLVHQEVNHSVINLFCYCITNFQKEEACNIYLHLL